MSADTCRDSQSRADHVLVVDDDEAVRQILSRLLGEAGHRCVEVGSGREALDACDARTPRLVVTDLCMPGVDGRALGIRLRNQFPGLPMILVTARLLDEPMLVVLRETFDEVMPKPIDPARFLDRVGSLATGSPLTASAGRAYDAGDGPRGVAQPG